VGKEILYGFCLKFNSLSSDEKLRKSVKINFDKVMTDYVVSCFMDHGVTVYTIGNLHLEDNS